MIMMFMLSTCMMFPLKFLVMSSRTIVARGIHSHDLKVTLRETILRVHKFSP